jgi:hypothetical protein
VETAPVVAHSLSTVYLCCGVGWGGAVTFMLTCTPDPTLEMCPVRDSLRSVMWFEWGGAVTFMLSCTPEGKTRRSEKHVPCKTLYMHEFHLKSPEI